MGSPDDFDFWLGTWRAGWESDDGPAFGENTVSKRFGGKVVYEQFNGRPGMDFEGMSVSVYSPELDAWLQTWVDDSGNYWDLVGRLEDGELTLLSSDKRTEGKLDYRMRFFDIEDDAFEWTWERSEDGRATWTLLWQIHYERIAPA
jgi:hypothetical protein